jgi:hypothetical protein
MRRIISVGKIYNVGAVLLFCSFSFAYYEDGIYQEALFRIERSINYDQVLYFAQVDVNGQLIKEKPIELYWYYSENGNIKPVNWIKRKFGYGVNILEQNENEVKFQFVSYDKQDFTLKKNYAGYYKVFTCLNNRQIAISKIFVQIDGGSFWQPAISRVEIHGKDVTTGKTILELIKP